MKKFMIKTITYEPIDLDGSDVVSVTDAAEILGMTREGVINAGLRGKFREVIDPERKGKQQGRRFYLRSEVEELANSFK